MTYTGPIPKLTVQKLRAQKIQGNTAINNYDLSPEKKAEQDAFFADFAKRTQPLNPDGFPHRPSNGRSPRATISNVQYMLEQYGIKVRFNEIKKRVDISIPGVQISMANQENASMAHILSLASINGMPTTLVAEFVLAIADRCRYNPVKNWIDSEAWDGQSRLADIVATVVEKPGFPAKLKYTLIIKWLLSAVAAIYRPDSFKTRGVLTFQGNQGLGKTSWLLSLVPVKELCDAVVKIDHCIDVSNKDSILIAVTHWFCELGEVESSLKKEMHMLKGFLTSNIDKVRKPYARSESEYPRQTVFFATVNAPDFLVDLTGNSRWLTIPVQAINFEHNIQMQQVFAELLVKLNDGAIWWLNKEEESLLAECNAKHMVTSYIRDLLLAKVNVHAEDVGVKILRRSVTTTLNELGIESPSPSQVRECAALLRQYFGEPKCVHNVNKWDLPFYLDDGEKHALQEQRRMGLTPTLDDLK
jgi:putative DNA primase/helicase